MILKANFWDRLASFALETRRLFVSNFWFPAVFLFAGNLFARGGILITMIKKCGGRNILQRNGVPCSRRCESQAKIQRHARNTHRRLKRDSNKARTSFDREACTGEASLALMASKSLKNDKGFREEPPHSSCAWVEDVNSEKFFKRHTTKWANDLNFIYLSIKMLKLPESFLARNVSPLY